MNVVSPVLSRVPEVVNSWISAKNLVRGKENEDTARTGNNLLLTVSSQILQTILLYRQFYKLQEICGRTHNYILGCCFALAIPPLIAIADHKLHFFRRVIHPLHNNLGSLCQIASVIILLALLQLGHVAYAATSLIILSLGYLHRRHYLPLFFRRAHDALGSHIHIITFLYGDWIDKCLAVTDLFDSANHFFQKRQVSYNQASHVSHLANYQEFNDIFTGKADVEVNREHIWIAPFPHVATKDFSSLQTFGDNFQWDIELLNAGLEKDARWQTFKINNQIESTTDNNTIKLEYAKFQLNTLITNVQNEQIETGEILDYTILKNYLGFITENLPSASPDLQQQIMIQLAVEGGDYCGPGIYYQLETAATALLQGSANEEKPRLPLKQRILLILQQERLKIIQSFHRLRFEKSMDLNGRGEADPHGINYTIQLIGSNFGLPDQGADQDKTAREHFIVRKSICWTLGMYPEQLWTGIQGTEYQGYSVERICNAVKTQIGIPLIPKQDVYGWAQRWIEKDSGSHDEFLDKLASGDDYEKNLQFKNKFLKAMLVDMGILQICSQ